MCLYHGRDMTRLLLFVVVIVNCHNAHLGKPIFSEKFGSVDSMFPARQPQFSRNSPALARNLNSQNSPEQSSLCYFLQESDLESQISCKLRFTRSKFNFNPFGLRFGKRGEAGSVNGKALTVNGNKLPYLWRHKVPT
ncbi:kisspeptin 2 isoform X2 [Chiloscyllium plagiosum]|uniref:kisspeptin 2 isoform X2 n=1 Tax=Chiloscyllium plagiosum TaxID=36176 RepID=UPI001CB82B11|nr:kisspeptin 2 isoform X2 [Chiloscyllium plagiosum]